MEDETIIQLFFARSEQAIGLLDGKYGGLCRRLCRNILRSWQDAEECVNDAYLGVWNAIPPARPSPLPAFVLKIVRNRALARYHANTAAKRGGGYDAALEELASCLASGETAETALEARELTETIEAFLDTLSPENRLIFLRRYWFSDPYGDIARLTGLAQKTVSVRLTRIRNQLRRYLQERGLLV